MMTPTDPQLAGHSQITLDALRFSFPENWESRASTTPFGKKTEELRVTDDTSIMLLPCFPQRLTGNSPSEALENLIEGHIKGRQVVGRVPAEHLVGVTEGSLAFATQQCVSRGPDGGLWFVSYWVLDVKMSRTQALLGIAKAKQDFVPLLEKLGHLIDSAELEA